MISIKKLKQIVHPYHVSWLVYRYISIHITRLLIYTPITPNQISAFILLLTLVAPVLIFFNYFILGGILLTLAAVLDYVDGEVARYKKIFSVKWGEFFDWVTTWLSYFLPLLALTLNVYFKTKSTMFMIFGILAIFGYAMVELIRLEDIKINPEKAVKKIKEQISFKKGLVKIYKMLFMVPYFHPMFLFFAVLNFYNFLPIKYFLLYYCIGFSLMWLLKVLYELFFGFKDEKKSK